MLRRFLNFQLSFFEKGKPLHRLRPLVSALDTFCYEAPINTKTRPHIRDAIDLKRWMMIVVFALLPTILVAIWNTGVQQVVYGSGDFHLMQNYLTASQTLSGYFGFTLFGGHFLSILKEGALLFLPMVIISYLVGGLCEGIIASIRGHEIAEGFLVTGILYPLILPSTMPYWMAALGIIFGVVIGKELFGGTGMNILNPALTARAFLFFTFPGKITGDVWIGSNSHSITQSLNKMNSDAHLDAIDGFTQSSALQRLSATTDNIKRIHVDAIASNTLKNKVATYEVIEKQFNQWNSSNHSDATLGQLDSEQLRSFVTAPLDSGGLGLLSGDYPAAHGSVDAIYGTEKFTDGNLFWGNVMGSMGETSVIACLLGAIFLVYTGVGSWRTMVSMGLGAFFTAFCFQLFANHVGADGGAWNPARYSMLAHRHLLMGGLAFGLVYMATDPVSSPTQPLAQWIYGAMIGLITILIRLINPAYPEGVMLAILFANVFAPLFDYYVVRKMRRRVNVKPATA